MPVPVADQPYAPPSSSIGPTEPVLNTTSVLLMVLLSLVTLGLYVPYWFLSRRRAFNRMAPDNEGVNALTSSLAALYATSFAFGFLSGVFPEAIGSGTPGFQRATPILDLASSILTIILSFRVKSILESNHPEPLSAVGTFFLSLFYLQYKINRMRETDPVAVQFTLR